MTDKSARNDGRAERRAPMVNIWLFARGGMGKEGSSFSEEKEAKRLCRLKAQWRAGAS